VSTNGNGSPNFTRRPGRHFFMNPGPTNIPDVVLRAMDRPTMDFMDDEFTELFFDCQARLRRVLKMEAPGSELFFYNGSGNAAWEASLVNLFSPGDKLLMAETGWFSEGWTSMAKRFGLDVQTVAADWRKGTSIAAIEEALVADKSHSITAVCVVHNETSTGLAMPIGEVRAALARAGHPALLLADTISSLGSFDFRMDEWGVDCMVGGGQKGLMLPVGMSFTGVSQKGMEAHAKAKLGRVYFDWTGMQARKHRSFVGTVPIAQIFGLDASLRLIEEEGLEQVFVRHHRLAGAVRAALRVWAGNNGPEVFCQDPSRVSDSVTAVLMPEGHDAEAVRKAALVESNVSLGGGLGKLGGRVFRIGHLGDLNTATVIGSLGAVELALRSTGVPHAKGGVEAALDALA